MKRSLLILLCMVTMSAFAQNAFKVTYNFDTNLNGEVSGADIASASATVFGGTKLTAVGIVDDLGKKAYKSHIVNNNNTSYVQTNVRMDVAPKAGNTIKISKITVTQRSSKPGVAGQSQTYLFRIGCTKNGAQPVNSNADQSTANTIFYDTYHSDSFEPGETVNAAGGDEYLSVWLTARGQSTTNDEFDWYIDKVEIEGQYVTLLELPEFRVRYDFNNRSKASVLSGETKLQASEITVNAASDGISTGGRLWMKTNANSNSIGYKLMGLYCDLEPNTGYEIVLKGYNYSHAGSGVANESRANRVGIYRDISRSAAGVLVKKEDFSAWTGRDVYGDAVNAEDLKNSVVSDNFGFDTKHYFTFSFNRVGADNPEYWTIDELSILGYVVPTGRSDLLSELVIGQEQLSRAVIGSGLGEYSEAVYNDYRALLLNAITILNDVSSTQTLIDNTEAQVQQANERFPLDANQQIATLSVNEAGGHEIVEGLSGYNSRLADSGWSFKNPEWRQAMKDIGGGWLRYMSGTRNNGFNMNIGLYEVEDLDQLIEHGAYDGGNMTCHRRVEAKGPQTVYDLYQGLGDINARLVVTWSGFIGAPWEAALFAKFCKDNHIEVDMWQFVNEPYFHVPNRDAYFWNGGTDFARKMHPIADSIKAYLPEAIMAPNSSWDDPISTFSKGIANYSPRFFNAFSKHSYAAYNTNAANPLDEAVKELVGGMYFAGTESYPKILDTYGDDIPVYVTEYQTWNTASHNIMMTGIYMAEYILRMTENPNTKLLGKHSNVSTAKPVNYYSNELEAAYNSGTVLKGVDELVCGYKLNIEGKAHRIINKGINLCDYRMASSINGDVMVEADNKNTSVKSVPALFAGVFKGTNGKRYIIVTNKSDVPHRLDVQGISLPSEVTNTFIASARATTLESEIEESSETLSTSKLVIRPYSVNRIEWFESEVVPSVSRIYDVKIYEGEVSLKWWTKENADSYVVHYGTDPQNLDQTFEVSGTETKGATIKGLSTGTTWYFAVCGKNSAGEGSLSKVVDARMEIPGKPFLVCANGRTESRLNGIATLLWRSVPDAHGYKIKYGTSSGVYTHEMDAGNVSGYRMSHLDENTTYYVVVVAYNGYGESNASNEMEVKTTDQKPVAPHQVRLTENIATGKLTIQWEQSLAYAFGAKYDIYRSDKVYTDYELVKEGVTGSSYTFNPKEKPGLWFYTVKARNNYGESFYSSNKYTITTSVDTWVDQVGIEDVHLFKYPVKVYPVPANDLLHVTVEQYGGEITWKLINMSGMVVKNGQFTANEEINVSNLANGAYFLMLTTEEGVFHSKVQIK
ncbi:MAG: T9SS type A sorting domain-containing protein [Bacteroidales bacterium]|nr:T9SS type A sorting domain-containing protein [Bacteroidales bacterium]